MKKNNYYYIYIIYKNINQYVFYIEIGTTLKGSRQSYGPRKSSCTKITVIIYRAIDQIFQN